MSKECYSVVVLILIFLVTSDAGHFLTCTVLSKWVLTIMKYLLKFFAHFFSIGLPVFFTIDS